LPGDKLRAVEPDLHLELPQELRPQVEERGRVGHVRLGQQRQDVEGLRNSGVFLNVQPHLHPPNVTGGAKPGWNVSLPARNGGDRKVQVDSDVAWDYREEMARSK